VVRAWTPPRRLADTERGEQFRFGTEQLERLIEAAGREFVYDAYFRRLDEHHRHFKRGAVFI
jgi:hypothetical protein